MSGDVPVLRVPGDKSISHRALMLATLAEGTSRIRGLLDAADVRATAACLRAVGAHLPEDWSGELRVEGPVAFRNAAGTLDAGNSGTTARLLLGLLAGSGVAAVVDGDTSLRRRPMDRVVYPLQALGAKLSYPGERGRLPVAVASRASGSLRTLRHRPRVASAQVKSSLLLAGLTGRVRVEIVEPGRSRDHTERLLAAMGAPVEFGPEDGGARVLLRGHARGDMEGDGLRPLDLTVPGDLSSASFLLVAALLAGIRVRIPGVGVNPTRAGVLDVLERAGVPVRVTGERREAGEPVADLEVLPAEPHPFRVEGPEIPTLLDEVPVLAVLAARAHGVSAIRGAEELRVKESDRLARVAEGLRAVGAACEELDDGLRVRGSEAALRGRVETGGDHRVAMAFGVLKAAPDAEVEVDDPGCVDVSYPGFWEDVARIAGAPASG